LSRRSPERSDVETLLRFWLPALAYVGLVLWLGAQPHLQSPLHFWNSDKVMHLFEYGPLGWLFARALGATLSVRAPRLVALLAVVLGVLVAGTDETIQRYTPGRESSLFDVAADAVGLSLAQVLYLRGVRVREEAA